MGGARGKATRAGDAGECLQRDDKRRWTQFANCRSRPRSLFASKTGGVYMCSHFPPSGLLDEMNLARVEYYFADFLSVGERVTLLVVE